MAFAIYGSSQLFCVVWQVMMFASFAVITYAYLQIEVFPASFNSMSFSVITYAYLQIEVNVLPRHLVPALVITYAYLQIEVAAKL